MTLAPIAVPPRGAASGPEGAAAPAILAAGPRGPTLSEDVVDIIRRHLFFQGDGGRAFLCLALANTGHWQRSCALATSGPSGRQLAQRMGETIRKATESISIWPFVGEELYATYRKNVAAALTQELAALDLLPSRPAAAARLPAFRQKITALEAAARAQDEKNSLDSLVKSSTASNSFFRWMWRDWRSVVYSRASRQDRKKGPQPSASIPVEVEQRLSALQREIFTHFSPDRYTAAMVVNE